MINAGKGRILFVAFILVSLVAPIARAQDGIVRAPVQKPQAAADKGDSHEAGHQAVAELGEAETVIPPTLLVSKRNPNPANLLQPLALDPSSLFFNEEKSVSVIMVLILAGLGATL